MMKFIHILKKIFTGGYVIRVGKYDENGDAKVLNFPKIAPWMTILIPLTGYFGNLEGGAHPITWVLMALTAICVFFGFFYYNVFKSERPKNEEEAKDDIIAIGFDKDKLKFKSNKKEVEEIPQTVLDAMEADKADKAEEVNEYVPETPAEEIVEVEEKVTEEVTEELEAPTMKNTKGEIISYLESKGIDYNKSDTKAKLLEKI